MKRTFPVPANTVSVANNSSAVICQATQNDTRGSDVYLRKLGTDLSPAGNQDYATFRLRVNGAPFYPFDNMTSRIAPSYIPAIFDPPIFLGHGVSVDVFGVMGNPNPGPTNMVAGFELLLVPKGEKP